MDAGSTTICARVATRSKRAQAKCSETSSPNACWDCRAAINRNHSLEDSSMEFELSKPQKLLQQSARELFARQCPAKRVRELMATETASNPELWSSVSDQGWL